MSASDALKAIETKLKEFGSEVEAELTQHLPEVATAVTAVESSPITQAVAAALHLPEFPEVMQAVSAFITVVDGALGNAKASAPQPAPAVPAAAAPAAVPATGPAAG